MIRYIDKSILVAEIERKIDEICNYPATEPEQLMAKGASLKPLMELRLFLDSPEIKEVDLEKEIEKVKKMYNCLELKEETIIDFCAKHFFELGLKAQKGE